MLLVSVFWHLGRKDAIKRSTQRWRSLVELIHGNEQHIPPQVIQWLCLFRNVLLVSAFRQFGYKEVTKRSKNLGKGVAIYLEMSYNTFSA